MTRRTIITIVIAVLAAALVGWLWFMFFGSSAPTSQQGGSFGTGGTRTSTGQQTTGKPTNIPSSIGQTVGTGGSVPTSGGYYYAGGGAGGTAGTSSSSYIAPNVNWLSGGSVGGGSGTVFNPSTINQLNGGSVGGSVNVLGTFSSPGGSSGSGSNIGGSAALIAGTAVACTAFLAGGIGGALTSASLVSVQVNAPTDNTKNFMDCLARTIAKAAIQQITNSVVNWINSGFNGQPSFITNYQQFFANVADQAAGEFIRTSTNFAPYCTPFRSQIQIALAQSYARRNSGSGQSCSLSKLLGGDVSKFLNGNFSSGGWKSFVSFTSNPNNNPYGAYAGAQVQLQSTIAQASALANRNISPSGFLNFQQPYDCKNTADNGGGGASVTGGLGNSSQGLGYSCPAGCKCKVTTPGSIVESSLSKTLGTSLDSLNLAKSFDEIISALISQLMTRALQGGVSNLSGQNGYSSYYLTADQQAAQSSGQAILTQMQGLVVLAQQYASTEQGSIQDIQTAQSNLNNLANCWQTAASSTALSETQQNIAYNNGQSALVALHGYDAQVASLNAQITRANTAIATLQELQTKTLNIGSTSDVASIENTLSAASAQGAIISQADVTQAQQDRATLQSQLTSVNQSTSAQQNQCYAFH